MQLGQIVVYRFRNILKQELFGSEVKIFALLRNELDRLIHFLRLSLIQTIKCKSYFYFLRNGKFHEKAVTINQGLEILEGFLGLSLLNQKMIEKLQKSPHSLMISLLLG